MARTTSTAHVVQPPLPPEASAPHFLLYNRIPKAGSTTLIALFRELSKRRTAGGAAGGYPGQQFKVTNAPREHYYPDEPFATESEDAETWEYLVELASAANASVGHLFINHMFRPDFAAGGMPRPLMIQVMREPIAREVSSFYYTMWGPRPTELMVAKRRKMMVTTKLDHPPSINEYVAWVRDSFGDTGKGCINSYHQYDGKAPPTPYNLQTRFFCGFHPACKDICSEEALEVAKQAMVRDYAVVGFLEKLADTLLLLELELPQWFAGATMEYGKMLEKAGHGRLRIHTKAHHDPPTPETMALLRAHHSQDIKLYAFAQTLFTAAGRRHGLNW